MSRPLAAAILLCLIGAAGPHRTPSCGEEHIVVRGDTLYSIARRCRSSVAAIARASGIADPARIEVGQRLIIPRHGEAARPGGHDGRHGLAYRAARGDTLYSLARWARVSLGALIAANPGIDPRKIEVGDAIRLPADARDPADARQRERGRRDAPPRHQAPESGAQDKPETETEPDTAGM